MGERKGVDGHGALPPVIIRNLNPSHRGGWSWSVVVVVVDLRDTQNMLETLYLSKCLQKGPNSPPEPINLEEWDHVSQGKAEDSKEGRMDRDRGEWRRKEGKKDGVRPEGSGERSSWLMFPSVVFPVILSPVIWISLNIAQTNAAF